jgi:hypothetical protein
MADKPPISNVDRDYVSSTSTAVNLFADYDDTCTDLLVDKVLFWSKIHKMAKHYKAKRGVSEREVLDVICDLVREETSLSEAAEAVMKYVLLPRCANL